MLRCFLAENTGESRGGKEGERERWYEERERGGVKRGGVCDNCLNAFQGGTGARDRGDDTSLIVHTSLRKRVRETDRDSAEHIGEVRGQIGSHITHTHTHTHTHRTEPAGDHASCTLT